jgi:hypothetical protein
MGAGRENRQPMVGGDLGHGLAQETQLRPRGRRISARERRYLDLRLQQLSADLTTAMP